MIVIRVSNSSQTKVTNLRTHTHVHNSGTTQQLNTISYRTCINYADPNNSMLRMRGHVSAGFFAVTSYSCKVNTIVFVILLQVHVTIIQHICSMKKIIIHTVHPHQQSETCPVTQNPIQRTVRTAHLSVLMTVHNFST